MSKKETHPLILALRLIAPSIVLTVTYSIDSDAKWDKHNGQDPRDQGMRAYDIEFTAQTIVAGEFVEGSAYLSETYEYPGDHDPDVGGYLPQKLDDAIKNLAKKPGLTDEHRAQITSASKHLEQVMKDEWDAQQEVKVG